MGKPYDPFLRLSATAAEVTREVEDGQRLLKVMIMLQAVDHEGLYKTWERLTYEILPQSRSYKTEHLTRLVEAFLEAVRADTTVSDAERLTLLKGYKSKSGKELLGLEQALEGFRKSLAREHELAAIRARLPAVD